METLSLHVIFPDHQNSEFRRPRNPSTDPIILTIRSTFSSLDDHIVAQYEHSFTANLMQFVGERHERFSIVAHMLRTVHVNRAPEHILQGINYAVFTIVAESRGLPEWDPRLTFDLGLNVEEIPVIEEEEEEEEEEEADQVLDYLFNEAQISGELGFRPASPEEIERLEKVVVKNQELDSCCICLEEFLEGSEGTKMPCQHCFHTDCIVEWLGKNRVCPLCRFQMP